jgi:hypothetical protein
MAQAMAVPSQGCAPGVGGEERVDRSNFLLTPKHPAIGCIAIGEPRELMTDLRLFMTRRPAE